MSTTTLDANQVIKKVYDEPTESLKVNATVVAQDITLIVDIDEADDSIQVYGNDGSVNRAIKTDSDGNLQVDVLSSALPTGAATEAKQDVGNASLASIDSDIDVALSTRASEATLSSLNNKINNDYGLSSGAVRTASQIGNAAGAADFNSGITTAQTLRTSSNITRNGTELSYNDGASDANTIRTSANIQRDGNDLDYNIGTPSANTIRTAAILSNNAGEIDYNAGITGAQTPRVTANITRNGTELSYNDGISDANTVRTSANIQRDGNDLSYNTGTVDTNTLRVTQATDVPVTVIQPLHDNLNVNSNTQVGNADVTITNPLFTTDSFEKFFPLIAASKWMELGVYDQIVPTYSVGNTVLTLAYLEDGATLGEAVINYSSLTSWSVQLNRYIDDDDGTPLLDDDDTNLNLD